MHIPRSASSSSSISRRRAATVLPLLSLAGVVAGTMAAIVAIPLEVEEPDSLQFAALLLAFGLAFGPGLAVFRNPRAIFRVQNIVGVAPIFWLLLEPLQAQWNAGVAGIDEVRIAFICIGVFAAAFWIANFVKPARPWRWFNALVQIEVPITTLFIMAVLAFFLAFLRFAIPANIDVPLMIHYLGEMRWAAPWARGDLGGWDAFLDHSSYFGYLLPSLFALLLVRRGWMDPRTIITLMLTIVIAAFLAQGGGRRVVGVLVLSGLLIYAVSQPRIRLRHLVAGMVVVAALMTVTQFILETRNIGVTAAISGESSTSPAKANYYHVDSNLWALSQLVVFIPEQSPHVYADYLVWVLSRPIPRVLWPGKPLDFGFSLPDALGLQGVSLSITLIGELYATGGFVAIAIGGWLYGYIAVFVGNMLTETLTASRLVTYGIVSLALFAGMRSGIDFVLMLYPILAWLVLLWIVRALARRHATAKP